MSSIAAAQKSDPVLNAVLQLKPLYYLPTTGGNFLSRDIINSGPS